MTTQDFLKTLKTAKRAFPSSLSSSSLTHETNQQSHTLFKTLINSSSIPSTQISISSLLSSLSSHQLHSLLSDPNVRTSDCLRIFNFVLHNQSEVSFKPDIHAHLTLICRLIKSRKFLDAEFLLKKLTFDPNYRYPFSDFASWVENYCKESKIITKLLNMLLKTYSDHQMFDMGSLTFDYMVEKGVERDERTCSVYLYAMTRTDNVDLAFEFFRRMVDSGMEVSVFSLTIVVSGLCKIGKLKMGRELVEEMVGRGIKPNVVTLNTLVDASARRWDFVELDFVLRLMKREGIEFNDTTYKILIEGYSGYGKIEEAERLLLEMHDKGSKVGTYVYYTVIRGYCRLGSISKGLSLYRKMQERKIAPDVDVYRCLISGLCRAGDMGQVKELVNEMQNKGGELDDVMLNTLLDGYRKAGMIDEVEELQFIVKMKCCSDHESCQNFVDSKSQVELVMDDEVKPVISENLR